MEKNERANDAETWRAGDSFLWMANAESRLPFLALFAHKITRKLGHGPKEGQIYSVGFRRRRKF